MLAIELLKHKTSTMLLLGFATFCLTMLLTPVYTHFAFKYKWWKQHRENAVSGEALSVIASLRIKRSLPLMAGLIMIVAITAVTLVWNLNRRETWLPLAGLLVGGIIGLTD